MMDVKRKRSFSRCLPSSSGRWDSYDISNWKGLRKGAGLSKTVTLVTFTALILGARTRRRRSEKMRKAKKSER